jgi:hypothetical protein
MAMTLPVDTSGLSALNGLLSSGGLGRNMSPGLVAQDPMFDPNKFGRINVPSSDFGFNAPTLNLAMSGLGTIGNLIAGFKALSLANKQFNFQKEFSEANLANQIKSYNTALADRSRARAAFEGQTPDQAQAYIDENRLVR